MYPFLYLSMNGANGSSFVFSKSDWLKYSSSKHSNQPSDTWGQQVKTLQESWYCSYQKRSSHIINVKGLDQNHRQSIQMVLRAVVKVVQFLFEILQNLCMTSHIRSKYQDDRVLGMCLVNMLSYIDFLIVLTPLTSLNSSGNRFVKILHSGELRIMNDTAQWWFSSGDMSLYLHKRSKMVVREFGEPSPDSRVGPGIYLVSVVVARMVQVMADTGREEDAEITLTQNVHQATSMDQNIPGIEA